MSRLDKKIILIGLLGLAGCLGMSAENNEKMSSLQQCPSERPRMCTADWRPVCGVTESGKTRTFGNSCNACGDAETIGYMDGECPE